MGRLLVYFLLDTSGSMYGEPSQRLNNTLSWTVKSLRSDVRAETLWISIITFDREVREIVPLTELQLFELPIIDFPAAGPTYTGKALEFLYEKVQKEVRKGTTTQESDCTPLLFIFTDDRACDLQLYREMIPKIQSLNFGSIVGFTTETLADDSKLTELADKIFKF